MPTGYSQPAEAHLIVIGSSSSRVTSKRRTATRGDGGERDPDVFKEFTDQELRLKIKRLSSLQRITPDGGKKARRFIYRVEKELDRRRAAGPRKVEEDAEEFTTFTDQELKFKIKRMHALRGVHRLPDGGKKWRECARALENELDRRGAAWPRKVEMGQRQAAQTPSVDDPYAFGQQGENTSNHAARFDGEATDGGLNPFASTNPEGEGTTCTNLGPEEVKPTISVCSGHKGEDTGKRDEHSQTAGVRETNLEFKIKQTQKLVEEVKETPKQEDGFTIEKCVGVLEAMEELTDVEKAKVLKLFKCGMNREIFVTTNSASVRLIWLRSEIYA